MGGIVDLITDRQFQISLLAACAAGATFYTIIQSLITRDKLSQRMRGVADHREKLKRQQRENFNSRVNLRNTSQGPLKALADNLRLFEVFDAGEAQKTLFQAGFRGERPVVVFMAARFGMPFLAAALVAVYVYVLGDVDIDDFGKLIVTLFGFLVGTYIPVIYVKNIKAKRQEAIQLAWPDALDLLLICVESGMSIELALNKVSAEVGLNSPELAEELGLTVAELSYLEERRRAFLNLAERTGLEVVKAATMALIQSERYGTPLGQSLRVLASDSREARMQQAEKKAAALPPKLTVPMIVFFLPVLFAVILGPAILGIMENL